MATTIKKYLSKKHLIVVAIVAAVVAALAVAVPQFTGERVSAATDTTDKKKVKLGIPDSSPIWDAFAEVAKRDHDIEVEFVNFSDWHLPNTSLQAGELDANAFQHTLFVSSFNANSGGNLRPIGNYGVTPASYFSSKIHSIDQLEPGSVVLLPKDPSNQGRALKLLQAKNLIELGEENHFFPSLSDISSNPKNLEFRELEGLQLPTSLPDADLVFLYHHQAIRARVDISTSLISDEDLVETEDFLPYHGVFVVQENDVKDPVLNKLPAIYHSPEVRAAVEKENKGQTKILDIDPAKFIEIQKAAEAEAKGSK